MQRQRPAGERRRLWPKTRRVLRKRRQVLREKHRPLPTCIKIHAAGVGSGVGSVEGWGQPSPGCMLRDRRLGRECRKCRLFLCFASHIAGSWPTVVLSFASYADVSPAAAAGEPLRSNCRLQENGRFCHNALFEHVFSAIRNNFGRKTGQRTYTLPRRFGFNNRKLARR